MRNAKCKKAGLIAVAAVALATTSPVVAETTQCTAIASLPYTISAPGSYCLAGDLTTPISTGNAITIAANSVILDLNGRKLAGNAGTGTLAVGISASGRRYIVIRNGTIRGFYRGVALLSGSEASVIEDITADGNYFLAFLVSGTRCVVRRNLALNTGGTTAATNASAFAFFSSGNGNTVVDNDVRTVTATGTGTGVGVYFSSHNSVAENNRIAIADVGVLTGGDNVLVSNNRFTDMPLAISFLGTGRYRNNLTTGVTTLASGGTDAGGND